jgi:hypothetical protein
MQRLNVHGTTDWKEYTVSVPVQPNARTLSFGFLLTGAGKAWADDLRLLVNGKPIAEAPKLERPTTILDTDHEFDGGSGITITDLSSNQIENLATLGKVWGFLKYHHPAVTAGKRHWDYDLFPFLPDILNAADRSAANAAMVKWVASFGEVPACVVCATLHAADTIYLRPMSPGLLRSSPRTRSQPSLKEHLSQSPRPQAVFRIVDAQREQSRFQH